MTAQTDIPSYDPSTFDHAAFHGFSPPPGYTRHHGWTPDKQRRFLEALSEGRNVVQACAIVGLSKQSAYALRTSPRGHAFALGWDAALLKARDVLADELMDRAFNGVRDTITRDDGSIVTRHRHDNRLGTTMLARLDRLAEAAKGPATVAQLIAADFVQYLDLIERDAGPARAGIFLGARVAPAGEEALAPLRALARADKWLRTHTDLAEPLATADLDPAERAGWTAEQWLRAEAVGLVVLAPEPVKHPDSSQASQAASQPVTLAELLDEAETPVWWDDIAEEWRTWFPPPPDFDGEEEGSYGDDDYERTLTEAEQAYCDACAREQAEADAAQEARKRDRYFGFAPSAETPAPADAPPSDEPPAASDIRPPRSRAARRNAAASCVEPAQPEPGETGMSIFGSIKNAIFGHKAAAPAQQAPQPSAQAPAQNPAQTPAMPQMQQPAAPAEPVDVENVLMVFETERGTADLNWRTSIVDLMKLLGLDSSLENRKQLATELGYAGAKDGSAEMNIWLHKAVMQELEKSGGKVPASLKD
nr:DUF3597 domain-containing protein [Sphingomonas psychrotolerans]